MEASVNRRVLYVTLALIAIGVVMRLLPHPANLAPVGAIALFGGAVLPRRFGWWLPVAIMVLSDLAIGFYSGIWFTWLGFLMIGLLGMTLRQQSNWFRVPVGVLGGGIIFFALSNLGVWICSGMYAHTWSGLAECLTMALPFFRNTLAGDLLYACVFFGAYAMAMRYAQPEVAKDPSSL